MLSTLTTEAEFDSYRMADEPGVFADIYETSVNLVVWQRQTAKTIANYVDWLLKNKTHYELRIVTESDDVIGSIMQSLPAHDGLTALAGDVNVLVTMFADLFELNSVGLRLSILDKTMCPRFHTDHLPCRLVTAYSGSGTQWLPEHDVDRTKLGVGARGLPDTISGIYSHDDKIQQLNAGDVALLKGSGWAGNEERAIVHRSPELELNEKRLLLTLDFGH